MACFYDMDEMPIPFGIVSCGGKLRYTLRVCKGCRSEWMQAILAWFETPRAENMTPDGIRYVDSYSERAQKVLDDAAEKERDIIDVVYRIRAGSEPIGEQHISDSAAAEIVRQTLDKWR
jgi:hypothetical protein